MIAIQIARIISDVFLFLETAEEEALDPDTAVDMLEKLADRVDQLDKPFLRELVDAFAIIAPEYDDEAAELVRNIPEAFGLHEMLAADTSAPANGPDRTG